MTATPPSPPAARAPPAPPSPSPSAPLSPAIPAALRAGRPGPRASLRTALLVAVATILVGWALKALTPVLVPLVFALLIALSVMPVRDWVGGRVPKRLGWLGVAAAMGVVLLVLALVLGGLALAGQQILGKAPEAAEQISEMLGAGGQGAEGRGGQGVIAGAEEGAQETSDEAAEGAPRRPSGGLGALGDPREALRTVSDQLLGAAGGAVAGVMNAGLAILGGLVLILFLTLLTLIESGDWLRKATRLLGRGAEGDLQESAAVVGAKVRRFLGTQAALGLVTSGFYAIWLTVWGVDLVLVWALLSFLMNFIPNVGSIVAGGTTTAYAFVTKDFGTAVAVGAGILAIEQVMGNLVAPRLQGRSLALSPLVVLVSLVFWTWVWGVAGALLSVPVTMALVVAGAHVPSLRPWALLLTDRTDMAGLDEAIRPEGARA